MTCFVILDDIERTNMATLDTIKDILQENLDIAPENNKTLVVKPVQI